MENKRRRLVRHIDGRLMVGRLPIKSFIIVVVISLIIFAIFISLYTVLKSPFVFLAAVMIIGIVILAFSEINNKETGIDLIKDMIRYKREGELTFERGNKEHEAAYIRCTRNQIQGKERRSDF
ncbi:hypothetical protein [Clostridium sp.]|uniref:hypothetical protein n=1 Tax=Clostridium sp. TaxID=1506 RepID=UPI003F2E12EA